MCIDWVAVALVITAIWVVPITATLALFPRPPRNQRHRRTGDHD